MMKKIYGLLLITACLLAACNKDAELPEIQPIAYASFYNGSPDHYGLTNVVAVNNDSTVKLTYNGTTSEPIGALNYASYKMMRPGSYRVTFTDTGSGNNKITDNEVTLQPNNHQTIYLVDSLGYFETLVSDDEVVRDPAMACIRLIHLAPDAPRVSMLLDVTKIPAIDSIAFRSITPFVKVSPNPKPGFRILYNDNGEEKTLVRKSFALLPGRSYTFILRGYMQPKDENPNKTINLSALLNQ